MNRSQFLADPDVIAFINWLALRLPTLPVRLSVPFHPRYVPVKGGVSANLIGVDAVTTAYMWRATGMTNGDWPTTQTHCSALAQMIRTAVVNGDPVATLQSAWKIIEWGGGNQSTGAFVFLDRMQARVVPYLRTTESVFRLATADTGMLVPPVEQMNAMLTKVHAFLATDGLPIYDSRVAAAIATLVEMWRRATLPSHTLPATPIPVALNFPSLSSRGKRRRTVAIKFHDAVLPKHLQGYTTSTARAWSCAKIRLGWLMEALLCKQSAVYASVGALSDRMRALEAALFMIGYDVTCL